MLRKVTLVRRAALRATAQQPNEKTAAFRAKVRRGEDGFPLRDSPRQVLEGQEMGRQVVESSREAHGKDSGEQAPRIKLSASKPTKMRQIRASRALISGRAPTSKEPIAGSRAVRITGRTHSKVARTMGRMRSRAVRIMGRMPNRVARILRTTMQTPTDTLGLTASGTAPVPLVLGAVTTAGLAAAGAAGVALGATVANLPPNQRPS